MGKGTSVRFAYEPALGRRRLRNDQMTSNTIETEAQARYLHQALLYDGVDQLVAEAVSFVEDAAAADEPCLVMLEKHRLGRIKEAAGAAASTATFADMGQVGRNPATIIARWKAFVAEHPGRAVRGIGEPIYAGRSPAQVRECQIHESLLNSAIDSSTPLWLLCPYDVRQWDDGVIAEALRSHPVYRNGDGDDVPSPVFADHTARSRVFDGALEEAPAPVPWIRFGPDDLLAVRAFTDRHSRSAGIESARVGDLVAAVHELALNSVQHGGGGGTVRCWQSDGAMVFEVTDQGLLADRLVGRLAPPPKGERGRGLWIANQLCDLLQIRSGPIAGTVVRAHMRIDPRTN